MHVRILSAPARPVRRALVTIIATTTIAAASVAVAQQQQPTQRPQAQPAQRSPAQPAQRPPAKQQQPQQRPAQPAPPQQAQQAPAEPPQLIYSPWTKFCPKDMGGGKQVCVTRKDARIESGMPIAAAELIEPEGEPKKLLRITVPLAMRIEHGTRIIIDQNQPQTAPYIACFIIGCIADYEVTADLINQFKKSQQLHIQAIRIDNQPITVPLALAEFAKAYDGPPTDLKVIEEQQKKLQDELQRRAEEARKKLESQQQQPTRTQ
jgi:invasion protein IalB